MSDAPHLLAVIYSDPESGGLAAEALRMVMGLGAGTLTFQVVLMGPAAKMLTEEVDDLVDGEMIESHLDVFGEWDTPFYVDRRATRDYDLSGAPVEVVPVGVEEVAAAMTEARQVMVFP